MQKRQKRNSPTQISILVLFILLSAFATLYYGYEFALRLPGNWLSANAPFWYNLLPLLIILAWYGVYLFAKGRIALATVYVLAALSPLPLMMYRLIW